MTVPTRPRFWTAARRIFELSFGEMLWSRRTLFMALVVGGPVLLAIVARLAAVNGTVRMRINGVGLGGDDVFGMMIWIFFLRFSVPVLGVFYGTALIADEVEDKTITYLFTRPIPRAAVLIGKYLAYLACTTLVVLPAVTIIYFVLVPLAQVPASFGHLLQDLGIMALGLAVYGALFALMGASLKRPLIVGLVFAFGWEQIALLVPGYLRQFTVAYHLQALVPHAMPSNGGVSLLQAVFPDTSSPVMSVVWLLAMMGACLVLAARAVERREYVLEQ